MISAQRTAPPGSAAPPAEVAAASTIEQKQQIEKARQLAIRARDEAAGSPEVTEENSTTRKFDGVVLPENTVQISEPEKTTPTTRAGTVPWAAPSSSPVTLPTAWEQEQDQKGLRPLLPPEKAMPAPQETLATKKIREAVASATEKLASAKETQFAAESSIGDALGSAFDTIAGFVYGKSPTPQVPRDPSSREKAILEGGKDYAKTEVRDSVTHYIGQDQDDETFGRLLAIERKYRGEADLALSEQMYDRMVLEAKGRNDKGTIGLVTALQTQLRAFDAYYAAQKKKE